MGGLSPRGKSRGVHTQAVRGCFKDRRHLAFLGSLEVPHEFKDTALHASHQKGFASEHDCTRFLSCKWKKLLKNMTLLVAERREIRFSVLTIVS